MNIHGYVSTFFDPSLNNKAKYGMLSADEASQLRRQHAVDAVKSAATATGYVALATLAFGVLVVANFYMGHFTVYTAYAIYSHLPPIMETATICLGALLASLSWVGFEKSNTVLKLTHGWAVNSVFDLVNDIKRVYDPTR